MKTEFVEYGEAAWSAERGGVKLSSNEYNGFADIGCGGVLGGASDNCDGLRLKDDTDGSLDGYVAVAPCDIVRSDSASGECLVRRCDGAVAIKHK